MKTISFITKGFVPGIFLLPIVFALYSFAPAHPSFQKANYSKEKAAIKDTITGTVSDAGGAIPGVMVSIKGKNVSTVTDENGAYSIEAEAGDVLIYTYPGYETVEIKVGEESIVDVVLFMAVALDEAVINAGYYTVKDKERTGSISRVTAEEIENQPVTDVLAAMQGRMAGVEIVQNSGVPGGNYDIKIRGQNSLRYDGNSPLYVIDGVPYSSESTGSFLTSYTLFPNTSSPLNSINPDAIESIEVLKDADATAIYGSRGANGVVLITTKQGKPGKTRIELNTSTGMGWVTRFVDMMNTTEYLAMRKQAFSNDGITEYPDYAYDVNGTWDANRNTDWQKELLGGTAQIYSLDGAVSGGSEQTRFRLGLNYDSQSTVFPGDFIYKKGGASLNLTHSSIDKKFNVTATANYVVQNNNQPSTDLTYYALSLPPNAPELYDENGDLNWEDNTWTNPLADLNGKFTTQTHDLFGNIMVGYHLFPFLEIKGNLGYTDTRNREKRTAPSTVFNPSYNLGPKYSSLYLNNVDRASWIAEPQISFTKELGQTRLNVLLGTTFQQQDSRQLVQYGLGFTSNSLINDMASASTKIVERSNKLIYKYNALFARINFDLNRKYILNLTGRRDGSSRFGPAERFANFGAAGTAWIFSRENFMDNVSFISFGKFRASYGTSGNDQIGDYQFYDTYSGDNIYQGITGLAPTRLYNPGYQWETNRKFETALELGFLKDRIYLTAAFYQNRSSNQLVGLPVSGVSGFTSYQGNLDGEVENKGWEFTLHSDILKSQHLKWESNLNFTLSKNKLLEFPGLDQSAYSEQYRIGYPLNIQLAYHYTGIDPDTGIYQFEDVNGDGQITFPEDRQTVVDLNPSFYGGFQNRIHYKRWSLDFLFQFVKQKRNAFSNGITGSMVNQPEVYTDSWISPGDEAAYQIFTTGFNQEAITAQSLYAASDALFVDASYVRLKNISLFYDVPLSNNLKCLLFIKAQNLFTVTSYQFGDPEVGQGGFLPPLKIFTTGLQFTF